MFTSNRITDSCQILFQLKQVEIFREQWFQPNSNKTKKIYHTRVGCYTNVLTSGSFHKQ